MGSTPHTLIRASAGTGKTFQLSNRYLQLLLAGASPESILASTFTRKAAGEILDRIVQRLARAAVSDKAASALASELERPDVDRQQFVDLLASLLAHLDRLQISTLDGYYAQLARRFCLELGLSPHWSIIDEARDAWLREEAIRRVLSRDAARDLIPLLAKGDTDRSVSQLIIDTVSDLYSIYQDSQPEAWTQVPESQPPSTTALESALELLRGYVFEKPKLASTRDTDLAHFDAQDFDTFPTKGLAKSVNDGKTAYSRMPIPDEVIGAYETLLKHVRAARLRDYASRLKGSHQLLEHFDQEYQRLKQQERGLRFEDVARSLDSGLSRNPPAFDPTRVQQPIEHLLLDEFQDTSPVQWRILQPVVNDILARDQASFFCVGDLKQAIYGWRGGVAEIFDAVSDHLGEQASERPLSASYRSSAPVISAVNQVFQRLHQHDSLGDEPGLLKWQKQFIEHQSARNDLTGYVELSAAEAPFDACADRVAKFHAQAPDATLAILVRDNKDVGAMMHRLAQRGVAASEESGKSIADSPAVQIMLSALYWLDHPADTVALFHWSQTGLGKAWGLEHLPSLTQKPDSETLHAVAAARRAELLEQGYGRWLETWTADIRADVDSREQQRLAQLIDLGYAYDSQATLRPGDFVQHVRYQKVSDPTSAKVRVMNIHQAKGLEFDAVFLPDLERELTGQTPPFVTERANPTSKVTAVTPYLSTAMRELIDGPMSQRVDLWRAQQIRESLSVLYVALTRAARALFLIVLAPEKPRKSAPKTWAGLLLTSLCDTRQLEDGEVGYVAGDPKWLTDAQAAGAKQAGHDPVTHVQPKPIVFRPASANRSRLVAVTSPSAQEGPRRVRLDRFLGNRAHKAMLRGTAVHTIFEQIPWLESCPNEEELLQSLQGLALDEPQRRSLVTDALQQLANPTAKRVLDQATVTRAMTDRWPELATCKLQLEAFTEYEFVTLDDQQLWNGSIDRLVLARSKSGIEAAEITDFKTDRVTPQQPEEYRERITHYRPQLQAYRRAVHLSLGIPENRIATQLWFVHCDEVESLSD